MVKRVLTGCVFLLLLLIFAFPAAAEEIGMPGEAKDGWENFRRSIPAEVADGLPEGFFSEDVGETADALRKATDAESLFGAVKTALGGALSRSAPLFLKLLGILLVAALGEALAGKDPAAKRALHLLCVLSAAAVSLGGIGGISAFFDTVSGVFGALTPLLGVLLALGGNVSAAALGEAVYAGFLSVLGELFSGGVMPVCGVCLALGLCGALCDGALKELSAFVRKVAAAGLSFLFLLLSFALGTANILAKGQDTLGWRTARFAASQFLPLVGSSVSEALRTVAGSVEYLRGVVGVGGMAVLFLCFLPTFCTVLATRVCFLLTAAGAKALGCLPEERWLSECAAVYGFLEAVTAAVFLVAVFFLTVFARCAAAGG